MKKKSNKVTFDSKQAAQALEYLFASSYVDKKRLYLENFLRGIFFSVGTVIGLAICATVLLWVLSLFDSLPFISNISDAIKDSVSK